MDLQQIITNLSGMVRHEELEGRKHLVVPMVMLTEGVHNGSNGPLYYPAEEMAKTPAVWNAKPIVVYHPSMGASACDPVIINSRKVGVILNTKFIRGNAKKKIPAKLVAEAWLEEERIPKVDGRVTANLESGEVMELSTGLFTDNETGEGEWNGEPYTAIARNYRPDHLALLPDQIGACSVADGAGLLRNQQGLIFGAGTEGQEASAVYNKYYSAKDREKMPTEDFGDPGKKAFPVNDQEDLDNAAHLVGHAADPSAVKARLIAIAKRKGLKVPESWAKKKGVTNAVPLDTPVGTGTNMSHSNIRSAIYDAYRNGRGVDGRAADGYSVGTNGDPGHIEDVYDDFHIMSTHDPKTGRSKLMKRGHEITPEGECYITGTPEEVRRVQEYRTVDGTFVGNAAPVKPPESEATQMSKKQHVDHLIANGGWEESDRAALDAMDEKKLEKLCANTKTAPTANSVLKPEAPAAQKPQSVEEYVANAPAPIREVIANGLAAHAAEKARLIGVITANKGNKFKNEYLEAQTVDVLNGLAALAAPAATPSPRVPSFLGAGTDMAPVANADGAVTEQPLALPVMNFERETKKEMAAAK